MTTTGKTLQDVQAARGLLQEAEEPIRLVRDHLDGELEDLVMELYRQFLIVTQRVLDLEIAMRKEAGRC